MRLYRKLVAVIQVTDSSVFQLSSSTQRDEQQETRQGQDHTMIH
jgi:hypothetical protein